MMNLKTLFVISLCFLVGCGSGGGSENTATTEPAATAPGSTDTSQGTSDQGDSDSTETAEEGNSEGTNETEEGSATEPSTAPVNDGIIDRDFDFSAVMTVELEVDVSAVSSSKSYVSLCHFKGDGSEAINYEDCLVRGATQLGQFQSNFEAAPHFQRLGLAVWFIDTSIEPLQYQVSRMEMDMGKVVITASN